MQRLCAMIRASIYVCTWDIYKKKEFESIEELEG